MLKKKAKNDQILSLTFELVPRFVLYINFVVVLTLIMTHFTPKGDLCRANFLDIHRRIKFL